MRRLVDNHPRDRGKMLFVDKSCVEYARSETVVVKLTTSHDDYNAAEIATHGHKAPRLYPSD